MESLGLRHRAYQGDADLQRLLGGLSRAHAGPNPSSLLHPGDLIWGMYQNTLFDPAETIELWETADGDLVGYGTFEGEDFDPQCFIAEDEQRLAFESEALALARERAQAAGDTQLRTYIPESDTLRHNLLTAQGFTVDATRMTRRGEANTSMVDLRQSLENAPADVAATAGFEVRPVGGEEEWPERVELHRTVWAPSRVSIEAYRELRKAPIYRPDLDLVAVAPNGRFAGYAIVWYDPASRVGEFEPVGTHPDFRRQGVGQAVMREGLRRLRALGARSARVMSSAHNAASIALYQSVGFTIWESGSYYRAEL